MNGLERAKLFFGLTKMIKRLIADEGKKTKKNRERRISSSFKRGGKIPELSAGKLKHTFLSEI